MSTSPTEYVEATAADGPLKESWLLLVSFYAVIVAGAVPLAAVEMTPVYVLVAAFLCLAHALLVGAGGRPLLSDTGCKLLSMVALIYGLLESVAFDEHISYSLGHFLLFVQLVLLFGPHRLRELRLIPIVVLFELMVAGIWALDLIYLPAFVLSGAALMANLMAVDMHSDSGERRRRPAERAAERRIGARDFAAVAWLPIVIVFLVTALLFPVLPRFEGLRFYRHRSSQMVTGFSENVSLREVGMLRQSDRPAFTVQFQRQDLPGQRPAQMGDALMRGTSLPIYREGQWFGYAEAMAPHGGPMTFPRGLASSSFFASEDVYELRGVDVPRRLILQKVKLEEQPGRTLFALYRPQRINAGTPYELVRTATSHDLINPSRNLPDNSYQVVSMVPDFSAQMLRDAGTPRPSPPWTAFWQVPDNLRPVLGDVRQQVETLYRPQTDYDVVRGCMRYLMDPTRFSYTLELPDYGRGDPVAGFLTQTHRGSCEQFSSAMALLLRMWDIPTRLVVGYKGGTYNPIDQDYLFRDRDAHAWVEVYFNNLGWVEFDPTPGSASSLLRAQGVNPAPSGLFRRLRQTADTLLYYAKMHWNLHVIGYSREQQRAFAHDVGEAAGTLAQDATSLLRSIWPGLPDLGFVQVVLLVVSVTFLGICLYLGAGWLDRALKRRRPAVRTVRFYEELLAIMRRKGLRRPLHQTPREFARDAAVWLASGDAQVEDAVNLVTELYYRARFGGYDLDDAEEARLREALRLLKTTPRPPRTPTPAPAP